MKKVIGLFIITVLAVSAIFGLVACGGGEGKTGDKGIVCKKLGDDDFYTVIGYVAEEGTEVLDISAAAQEKYGNDEKTITVGRIRKGAFDGNTTLKEVIVSDSVEGTELTIDDGAFRNMRALKKITLPFVGANRFSAADMNVAITQADADEGTAISANDKKRLFGYIFGEEESDALAAVTQSYGDKSDMTATFYIPATLTEIKISAAKEAYIPMYAFCGLAQISSVTLEGNIKAIGRAAFKNMSQLKKVNIPKDVTVIYDSAFEGTDKLKTFGDDGFKFDAESTLAEIKDSAFKGTKLTTFDLTGTQVTVIGDYAFYGSALVEFRFAATVESVGAYAFAGSENLQTLVNKPADDKIGVNAFAGTKA